MRHLRSNWPSAPCRALRPPGDKRTKLCACIGMIKLGPAPLEEKCVGEFCCINFGGFCWGFSWRIFLGTSSHKKEEKKSGDKIRAKTQRPKYKNPRTKNLLPKTDPNKTRKVAEFKRFSCFYPALTNFTQEVAGIHLQF